VTPADTTIPIIELKDKHKVVVEAIARLGIGRTHSKWQAGVASGFKNMPIITIGECDYCGKCVEVCPRDILKIEGNKVKVVDVIECSMCRLCEDECDMDAIKLSSDPRSFVMIFETTGALSAKEIALEAAGSIKKRAEQLSEIVNAL
jgi:DNA-directed RNA polymerase subunit D